MIEQSLVLMKPDAVQRGIVGEILHRFERAGLKIVGTKMFVADTKKVESHYKKSKEWKVEIGSHRIKDAQTYGLDIKEYYGTEDPETIGDMVNRANIEYMTMGPVIGFVFEGPNAVEKIRKLVGHTFSLHAEPGTIRGDYGLEVPLTSLLRKRSIFNVIHASGTVEEAKEEVALWFSKDEILSYKRVHDELYSY